MVVQTVVGHVSNTMTYDRYGHLLSAGRQEAARHVDGYLAAGAAPAVGAVA